MRTYGTRRRVPSCTIAALESRRSGACLAKEMKPVVVYPNLFREKVRRIKKLGRHKNPQIVPSMERQKEIVRDIFDEQLNGREFNARELIAAYAIRYGTYGHVLLPYVNALEGLTRDGIVTPSWMVDAYRSAVKNNRLVLVEEALRKNIEPMTSHELIDMLYEGKRTLININELNNICNLLELITKIKKLPTDTVLGHNVYRWIHDKYSNTDLSMPTWNIKYVLLGAFEAAAEPLTKQQLAVSEVLCSSQLLRMVKSGVGLGHMFDLKDPLDSLERQLLIARSTVQCRSGKRTAYALTDNGRALLSKTKKAECLVEDLRIALLDERRIGAEFTSSDKMMYDKIVYYLTIEREIKNLRAEGEQGMARIISKRTGHNESYIRIVMDGKSKPWSSTNPEKLKRKFLSRLKTERPELVDLFKRHIEEREREVRQGELPLFAQTEDPLTDPHKSGPGE